MIRHRSSRIEFAARLRAALTRPLNWLIQAVAHWHAKQRQDQETSRLSPRQRRDIGLEAEHRSPGDRFELGEQPGQRFPHGLL